MKTSKFKMTELGPIPEDWEVKRLGDLFELSAAGDLQSECSSRVKTDINIHPIYSNGLENAGLYGYTSKPRYKADSITITGRGTLGHAEYRTVDFDAIIRLIVMRPSERLDGRYVTFQINYCAPFHFEITSIPQLTVPQVAQALIPVSPIPEQERIAEALSDVDALLSAMATLIEKKRAIKQGTMHKLLTGKTRLQGFGDERAEFKQTELGPIPNDWDVKRIDQCGDVVTGSTPPRGISELWGGSFNWISARDFKGKYIISSEETVTDAGKRYCRALPANSVLVTCIASIGLNAIAKQPCATNQQINAVVCRECDYEYFYYQCCFNESRLRQMAGQTAVPIIGKSQFEAFSIALPKEIKEQQAIAAVLSDMDAEIAALEAKRAKYESIKQGMMQELLTGKIRLSRTRESAGQRTKPQERASADE